MTHSLHRTGSADSLQRDFVLLCTPANGLNNQGAAQKLIRILDILMDVGPANIGFYGHGSLINGINIEEIKKTLRDTSRVRCCFDDREKLKEALRRIKAEDFGLSITVSGLVSEIQEISNELGLTPHSINISCGCFGNTERLLSGRMMELPTMCGHGMISLRLVESVVARLRQGTIGYPTAVRILGEPCTCGIFNPGRANEILHDIVENGSMTAPASGGGLERGEANALQAACAQSESTTN